MWRISLINMILLPFVFEAVCVTWVVRMFGGFRGSIVAQNMTPCQPPFATVQSFVTKTTVLGVFVSVSSQTATVFPMKSY